MYIEATLTCIQWNRASFKPFSVERCRVVPSTRIEAIKLTKLVREKFRSPRGKFFLPRCPLLSSLLSFVVVFWHASLQHKRPQRKLFWTWSLYCGRDSSQARVRIEFECINSFFGFRNNWKWVIVGISLVLLLLFVMGLVTVYVGIFSRSVILNMVPSFAFRF